MSTHTLVMCDLCGSRVETPAVSFVTDVDVCESCADRPIRDLGPLFESLPERQEIELSGREQEVLELMGEGLSIPDIAARMYVSASTAKTYASRLYRKLGAVNRAQAMVTAARSGAI